MGKRKYTQDEIDRIRKEYEAWDKFSPDSETAEELARRLGINKPMLYLMRRRGWRADAVTPAWAGSGHQDGAEGDLAPVVRYLTEQLVAARVELAAALDRIAELEAQLGGD